MEVLPTPTPPPPPPPLDLTDLINKPQIFDPVMEKLMKLAQKFEGGDVKTELNKKHKTTEEKNADSFIEAEADGIKKEINIKNKVQCLKCEMFFLHVEIQSHLNSHSSKILDWLFLGGARNANNEKELKERDQIDVIINVSEEVMNYFPNDFEYINYPVLDECNAKISHIFTEFSSKLSHYKIENKNVLVHCIQGISRSTSMVLSYLVHAEKMTLKQAYELVISKRPIARPNKGFLRQLIEFEIEIHGKNSLCEEDVYPLGTKLFMSLNC